jgi:peptidylprolyl isomerase
MYVTGLFIRLLGLAALARLAVSLPSLFGRPERGKQWSKAPEMALDPQRKYSATLQTTEGEIVIDLLADQAPQTVNNFVFLAREGFYDGVPFHRIIRGFMVQTGDPTGTGTGGPGYRFADEPVRLRYTKGTVAMANAGPNTNGSQFFIVHAEEAPLPPNYTIFGRVRQGLDVVDKIANTPVEQSRSGERSRPQRDVRITSVAVGEEGEAAREQ